MSNRFNKGRNILKRPKICLPPLPPEEVFFAQCNVRPLVFSMKVESLKPIEIRANNPDLPADDPVQMMVTSGEPFTMLPVVTVNDDAWHEGSVTAATLTPKVYTVVIRFEWQDGQTCEKTLTVTVTN